MIKSAYKKIKIFFDKYEKILSPLAMVIGFVVDNLTLQRADLWVDNMVIIVYFVIVIFAIVYLNTYKKFKFKHRFLTWLNLVLPFVLQMVFGGLFSAFMVFYSRSASLFVSWPFILILFSLLIGNELFLERYKRLTFHLAILYLAIFAYSVFAVPLLLGRIGMDIFLASGGVSLLLISLVILLLHRIDSESIKKNKENLLVSIIFIYLVFNILYFLNLIPPIPLAMKSGGVYHQVARVNGDYQLVFEKPKWYKFWRETSSIYHHPLGKRVYIFSSIFAPAKFKQTIYHRWLWYDEDKKTWIEKDKLSYSIRGGRGGGYRGYSYKTVVSTGQWRVDVMTDRGQILGRIRFEVEDWTEGIELSREVNK